MVAIAGSKNKNCRDNQNWTINKILKDGTSKIYTLACYGYKKS